jgi:hypothetical protein
MLEGIRSEQLEQGSEAVIVNLEFGSLSAFRPLTSTVHELFEGVTAWGAEKEYQRTGPEKAATPGKDKIFTLAVYPESGDYIEALMLSTCPSGDDGCAALQYTTENPARAVEALEPLLDNAEFLAAVKTAGYMVDGKLHLHSSKAMVNHFGKCLPIRHSGEGKAHQVSANLVARFSELGWGLYEDDGTGPCQELKTGIAYSIRPMDSGKSQKPVYCAPDSSSVAVEGIVLGEHNAYFCTAEGYKRIDASLWRLQENLGEIIPICG